MYRFLIVILFFNTTATFAGNEVGNGGIGFWCAQTKKYLLLDFHEHDMLYPDNKVITENRNDFNEILDKRLLILSKLDEKASNQYKKQIKSILVNVKFLGDIVLNKTLDSFEIAKPAGCELEQFAIQRKKEENADTDFYFDKKIWSALGNKEKAGLILHEVIYEHFILIGEKNSIKARKYNAFIFSGKFEKITIAEYNKFIQDLRLTLY